MPVIANTHPKGGVGKTTSSVNIVGEMKSDTVDLDTHTGLSIILGLRPECGLLQSVDLHPEIKALKDE